MSITITRQGITEIPAWTATLASFDEDSITDDEGWTIGCDTTQHQPTKGDLIEYWGKGFGYTVRGIAVGGHVYRYHTEAEQRALDIEAVERREREQRERFEGERAEHDARYNALPPEFKARIDRFRAARPDWRWKFESYEMVCCVDAVKIAEWCKVNRPAGTTWLAAVRGFHSLPHEQHMEAGLDPGHSGNTFGFACRLAYLSVLCPPDVVREHGALTPLVGCDDYGCRHDVEEDR